ncbi:MAG: cytochrome b [Pseudomonadota bacterium]
MALLNDSQRYGALTKFFHWIIVALFALQYAAGYTMVSLSSKQTALGLTQANYYNWHKSIGLVVLVFATLRLLNRTFNTLPDFASSLTPVEKRMMHHYENVLYLAMFVMPISGYIYVMAGGYGVHFFEVVHLTNPIGKTPNLAFAAKWTHILSSYVILIALVAHLGVVLRHQLILKNGLLSRMTPGSPDSS